MRNICNKNENIPWKGLPEKAFKLFLRPSKAYIVAVVWMRPIFSVT